MILLDTCAVLRLGTDPGQLGQAGQRAIAEAAGHLLVSAITAFEIAHVVRKRRFLLPPGMTDPGAWYAMALAHHGLTEIPLDGATAAAAVALPPIHADPCDRFIIATALAKRIPIVTCDQTIPRYPGVTVLW